MWPLYSLNQPEDNEWKTGKKSKIRTRRLCCCSKYCAFKHAFSPMRRQRVRFQDDRKPRFSSLFINSRSTRNAIQYGKKKTHRVKLLQRLATLEGVTRVEYPTHFESAFRVVVQFGYSPLRHYVEWDLPGLSHFRWGYWIHLHLINVTSHFVQMGPVGQPWLPLCDC